MGSGNYCESIDERAIGLIRRLDQIAGSGEPSAWLIGGSVRDILLGRAVTDYDICTSLLPEELITNLSDLKVIETGLRHGTVTVIVEGLSCEVTTLREEGEYSDKRHPDQVRFVRDLELDLARRDFTMNAIAWHPDSGFVDPLEGMKDIGAALIRAVGDPFRRFSEDALRILRAIRFSAELDFRIEEGTAVAMNESYAGLQEIARERIIAECRRTMSCEAFARLWLEWPRIWEQVFPQLTRALRQVSVDQADDPVIQAAYHDRRKRLIRGYDASASEVSRFVYLLRPLAGEPLIWQQQAIRHLRLPRQMSDRIIHIAAALSDREFWSEDKDLSLLARNGLRRWDELWPDILLLAGCLEADDLWIPAPAEARKVEALKALTDLVLREGKPYRLRHLAVGGKDLIRAGFKAGPELGDCLEHLLDQVISDTVPNERRALLAEASRYFGEKK